MRRLALGEQGSLEAMAAVLGADEVLLAPGTAHATQVLVSDPGEEAEALRAAGYGASSCCRSARAGTRGLQPPRAPVDALPARPRPHPRAPARSRREAAVVDTSGHARDVPRHAKYTEAALPPVHTTGEPDEQVMAYVLRVTGL